MQAGRGAAGTLASTASSTASVALSTGTSAGTAASTATSTATSAGTAASSADSAAESAGALAGTASSAASSTASVALSTGTSAGTAASTATSTATSQNTSQSTNVSAALSAGTSAGTAASTALSTATSAAGTLVLTAAPGSDHSANGIIITLTANEAQAFGDACFINSGGKAQLIDADAIATMGALVMCADASVASAASGNYLMLGVARDDTWAWTVGAFVYGSTSGLTGSTLTQTAPSGTDDVIQILGVATHANRMIWQPQLVQVEHT